MSAILTYASIDTLLSGGGNHNCLELNSAAVPLQWMVNQSIIAGLRMMPSKVVWKMERLAEMRPKESMTLPYSLIEAFPFKQLTYKNSSEMKL